jgi:hypothetical protein
LFGAAVLDRVDGSDGVAGATNRGHDGSGIGVRREVLHDRFSSSVVNPNVNDTFEAVE